MKFFLLKWILNIPNSTVFMGAVGSDLYAEIIVQKANEIGLRTLFQTIDKEPTATCAVLLTDSNRSMVAHLGAAYHFTENFLEFHKNWSIVENSRLFYITVIIDYLNYHFDYLSAHLKNIRLRASFFVRA